MGSVEDGVGVWGGRGGQGCVRMKRTSEVVMEAVGQAVGGGCQSG